VLAGTLLQAAGVLLGGCLIVLGAHLRAAAVVRLLIALVGWLLIYICCHSLGHWLVGTLVGIRFRGYGVRGTDHPDELTPALRFVLTRLPMFTAMTDRDSMRRANPIARAAMFAAGETSTILAVFLSGLYVWRSGLPGGLAWFIISVLMCISGLIEPLRMPRGDYAKALRALRGE
jgi:hypothetical protein